MADPEIKSYEPHHESQSAAVTESRPAQAVLMAIAFAFLGTPRTTRQSRNFSITCAILAVFGLRTIGFACSVMAVKSPMAVVVQYLMLALGIGAGLWIIIWGSVIEPPAALIEAINKSNARILRLFRRRPATA